MNSFGKARTFGPLLLLFAAALFPFQYSSPAYAANSRAQCVQGLLRSVNPSAPFRYVNSPERAAAIGRIQKIKESVAYPDVPSVYELSLSRTKPEPVPAHRTKLSVGLADPLLERARELGLYPDFKVLSDLQPRTLTGVQKRKIEDKAIAAARKGRTGSDSEKIYVKTFIDDAYVHQADLVPVPRLARPKWKLDSGKPVVDAAFSYTERTWSKLIRKSRKNFGDSHLPTPYPVLIPGGRFSEHYYWDMFFGVEGALATGRIELARMQVENLLTDIQKFGFVPNGGRDYYLTRSQPPMLSSMVRNVFEESLREAQGNTAEIKRLHEWLRKRAMPLLEREYRDFWMNPATRLDAKTGLNHHWDDLNLPRPERHGADNELALGATYRDVRAAAESGLDFTDVLRGHSSEIGSVLLNGVLGKVEQDLAWMARLTGDAKKADGFLKAFARRKRAMDQFLWNPSKGFYENYNLTTGKRVEALSADTFVPLYAGLASESQATRVRDTLQVLEKPGGVMASELTTSFHQWDGNNGWAPFQYFAIQGLKNNGFADDSRRLAEKWVNGLAVSQSKEGSMYERIDVATLAKPVEDGKKYDPQPDFLWSIGTYDWAAIRILGHKLTPLERRKTIARPR